MFEVFNIFTPKTEKTKSIEEMCSEYGISNSLYTINGDNSIDVNGHVHLKLKINNSRIKKLPLRFRNINGSFSCDKMGLETLEGCPVFVRDHFSCRNNNLTSLKGSPKIIGGVLLFENNMVSSFEGLPEFFSTPIISDSNPIDEIFNLNPVFGFIDMLNEYNVIKDDNKIIEIRLRQALEDSGCRSIPQRFHFRHYKLI